MKGRQLCGHSQIGVGAWGVKRGGGGGQTGKSLTYLRQRPHQPGAARFRLQSARGQGIPSYCTGADVFNVARRKENRLWDLISAAVTTLDSGENKQQDTRAAGSQHTNIPPLHR